MRLLLALALVPTVAASSGCASAAASSPSLGLPSSGLPSAGAAEGKALWPTAEWQAQLPGEVQQSVDIDDDSARVLVQIGHTEVMGDDSFAIADGLWLVDRVAHTARPFPATLRLVERARAPGGAHVAFGGEQPAPVVVVATSNLAALAGSDAVIAGADVLAIAAKAQDSDEAGFAFNRFYGWDSPTRVRIGGTCCGDTVYDVVDVVDGHHARVCSHQGPPRNAWPEGGTTPRGLIGPLCAAEGTPAPTRDQAR